MAQFAVFKNKNPQTKSDYPLLVDVQATLLDELQTRVVIPLSKAPVLTRKPMNKLTPMVEVDGEKYLLMTPQLAGVSRSALGTPVQSIAEQRDAIISALDMLITGV